MRWVKERKVKGGGTEARGEEREEERERKWKGKKKEGERIRRGRKKTVVEEGEVEEEWKGQ